MNSAARARGRTLALMAALLVGLLALARAEARVAETCDQERAQQLYDEARAAATPEAAVDILARSLATCPTFKAGFQRAKLLLDMQRADAAYEAAEATLELTPDGSAAALVRGLLGAIQAKRGEICDAITGMNEARQVLGSRSPKWLETAFRDLDRQLASQTLRAPTIECVLTGRSGLPGRSLAVESRGVDLRVHFAFDSATLEPDGRAQVRELAAAISAEGLRDKRIRIIGHTDSQGSEEYNQKLSERRAEAVRREILDREPSLASSVTAEGRGESQLRDPAATEEAHRLNRRVEVTVAKGG